MAMLGQTASSILAVGTRHWKRVLRVFQFPECPSFRCQSSGSRSQTTIINRFNRVLELDNPTIRIDRCKIAKMLSTIEGGNLQPSRVSDDYIY